MLIVVLGTFVALVPDSDARSSPARWQFPRLSVSRLRFIMLRRWWQGAAVCLLAAGDAGGGDSFAVRQAWARDDLRLRLRADLLECNHVGCPDSDRMIGELRAAGRLGWHGHGDSELVFGEVWADGAGSADSRWL